MLINGGGQYVGHVYSVIASVTHSEYRCRCSPTRNAPLDVNPDGDDHGLIIAAVFLLSGALRRN